MALVCHQGLRQVPVGIKWVQSVTPWVILGMTALVYMLEQKYKSKEIYMDSQDTFHMLKETHKQNKSKKTIQHLLIQP